MNEQIVPPKDKALKQRAEPQMSDFLIYIQIYPLIIGYVEQWHYCFITLSYWICATNTVRLQWRMLGESKCNHYFVLHGSFPRTMYVREELFSKFWRCRGRNGLYCIKITLWLFISVTDRAGVRQFSQPGNVVWEAQTFTLDTHNMTEISSWGNTSWGVSYPDNKTYHDIKHFWKCRILRL